MYEYKARVVSVYDGDTIRINVDLGFGVENKGNDGKGMIVRLYGINAPELRGDEKAEGFKSRDYLRSLIQDKEVIIKTIKDETEKYGRYLGKIYLGDLYVNDDLVQKGYAKTAEY